MAAAFGRLCVETTIRHGTCFGFMQPPSGGCVLKPWVSHLNILGMAAAAFGRLCVETVLNVNWVILMWWAAAFGRLCVETIIGESLPLIVFGSRLRAAVCWNVNLLFFCVALPTAAAFGRLCVETVPCIFTWKNSVQPPSGGCVLKQITGKDNYIRFGSRLRAAVCWNMEKGKFFTSK